MGAKVTEAEGTGGEGAGELDEDESIAGSGSEDSDRRQDGRRNGVRAGVADARQGRGDTERDVVIDFHNLTNSGVCDGRRVVIGDRWSGHGISVSV